MKVEGSNEQISTERARGVTTVMFGRSNLELLAESCITTSNQLRHHYKHEDYSAHAQIHTQNEHYITLYHDNRKLLITMHNCIP